MRTVIHTVLAIALGAIASAASVAAAEGEFDVAYAVTSATEGPWLPIGPNRRQQMNLLELTMQKEAVFLGTTIADCHYNREEDTGSGAYANTGWCAWSDKDGDLIFEHWDGSASSGDAMLIGSGRLTGGTGKFAGITGTLSWRYDGQLGRQRGFYHLPGS